jgi:uncharacterized delta-60 repeat protein
MYSYIEIDENLSFPSSSNVGKMVFGVNDAKQATLTNESGVTTIIGGGTGSIVPSGFNYKVYAANLSESQPDYHYSGFLIAGEEYTISGYAEHDDFSNIADVVSGIINTEGCVFIATGASPNRWNHGSELLSSGKPRVNSIDINTLGFTPEWIYKNAGIYAFNFSESVDYNKIVPYISPNHANLFGSAFALNDGHFSFYDETFSIELGFDNTVYTTAIQSDGKIVCGGAFRNFNLLSTPSIARLNINGRLDDTFSVGSGFDNTVNVVAIQSDGKILVGGAFAFYKENPIASCIARLDSSGSLDTAFNTNAGTGFDAKSIQAIAIQPDGKIVCGGNSLSNFNGTAVNGIFRLNTDGTLDTTFNVGGSGFQDKNSVLSIAIQPDGKIICVGQFGEYGTQTYNGTSIANHIVRLNTNGTLDTTFNTNAGTGFNNKYVASTAIQSDGKILCGGDFIDFDGNTIYNIARLNTDGTFDTTFTSYNNNGFNNTVQTITIQADDSILCGGDFTLYNFTTSNCLIRLDKDGNILNDFNNTGGGLNGTVYSISLYPNNKIIVGGTFNSYDGNVHGYGITRLYAAYDVILFTQHFTGKEVPPQDNLLNRTPIEIRVYN